MMTSLREIGRAIGDYRAAFRFIHSHRLYLWLWWPVAVNLLLVVMALALGEVMATQFQERIDQWLGWDDGWWNQILRWTLGVLSRMLIFFVYALVYKQLVLIILAPVLAYLSEQTEALKTGRHFDFSWRQLFQDALRGAGIALRNLFLELLITLLLFFFAFIPLVGLLAPVFLLIVQAYFFGFSMIDYSCERSRWSVGERLSFMRSHRGLAIGNGLMFYGLFLIPYLGWAIAPVLGIVAGTLSFLHTKKPGLSAGPVSQK